MTPAALIAFAICFVAGPALSAGLMRLPDRRAIVSGLALVVATSVSLALWLQDRDGVLAGLALLWLAWVLSVTMIAMGLRRRTANPRPRRWITVSALLATTLPWFGLATADLMV
ncbi:hypothetical protein [Thetidibacter halocola]|uniref:Uncharacterized protein n=1 Tax=Thetidibacter halocola TaxID=2827239 RepID=A0A8J8B8Q9_9RHOB|nr:hypothetical protein [Thetidibacter halocola]MBS0125762.1 hypothetical protein [Thetidibacter halocola]